MGGTEEAGVVVGQRLMWLEVLLEFGQVPSCRALGGVRMCLPSLQRRPTYCLLAFSIFYI